MKNELELDLVEALASTRCRTASTSSMRSPERLRGLRASCGSFVIVSFPRRLKSCTKEFGPLDKLWTCAKEWVEQSHAWHELPLPQVDAEAAASKAGEFGSQLARVSKVLEKKGESRENAARCCKLLLQETKSFEDDEAPLMLLVCEPGMKQRHWDEIKATTKLEFAVTPSMNMMQLMDIGLNHYVLTRRQFP